MSVLSLPVVFSQSTSPSLGQGCIFRSARFLREGGVRCLRGAARARSPAPVPPRPRPMPRPMPRPRGPTCGSSQSSP